jgi:hypothetical protein
MRSDAPVAATLGVNTLNFPSQRLEEGHADGSAAAVVISPAPDLEL